MSQRLYSMSAMRIHHTKWRAANSPFTTLYMYTFSLKGQGVAILDIVNNTRIAFGIRVGMKSRYEPTCHIGSSFNYE